ncbi:AAEL008714-PA [Aedes aegypti]|uniref:AAEL008714-PA n=1 Tax=Aedes aegypti TaxID=7159 RepID=Q16Y01_AEDAE|nr:AAEL008714-PA [Aedes aegypti]
MDEDIGRIGGGSNDNEARTKTEIDIENHVLNTTVRLSDNTDGKVFSRNGRNKENQLIYSCHLCGVTNLPGERVLQTHIAGRKHQTRMSLPSIDAEQFRNSIAPKVSASKTPKIQMHIAPGEPVPPGMENEVKPVAELQATIDRFKEGPMVGLEYIMELTTAGSKEPSYHCVLCDKKGDPRTIVVHITSYIHRMKFLEKHYPTVVNELVPYRGQRGATKEIIGRVIQTVCEAIEDHHGRLTPYVHESGDYARNKMKYLQEALFEKHFDERTGPKFVEVIDKKMLQEQIAAVNGTLTAELTRDPSPPVVLAPQKKARSNRAERKSLDSISSADSVQSISSESRSPPPDKRKALPTPKELSLQASEIAHERYKWEKYRCSLEIAVAQLEKTFKEHEKNPEKHPMYPEEWKKFWNRRYKELQAEKKDPSKHDFKPEWIGYWTKRMKELHDEEIDKKKAEIKKRLNLPDEDAEKVKDLKEQYKVKVAKKKSLATEPIDSSDDERMSIKSKGSTKQKNSRAKRSRSPISDDDFEETSRHSSHSRHFSKDRDRERQRPHYRMSSYMQEQQDYDDWAKNYYGPNKKVFVRTELDAEDTSPLNFVAVCRLLTALEDYLGSLGPKVIDLLSKSLALEKVKANSADELLLNEDNCMFLETVKEKLKGHLMADMVEPQKIAPIKKAIKNIASLIHEASKKEKVEPQAEESSGSAPNAATSAGGVDKAAIAAKLAAALVAQGKTDFTSEELEQLINVYVAMAEASKEKDAPVTASSFLNEASSSTTKTNTEKRPETSSRRSDEAADDNNALEGLTDSDLQTLLQNFKDLSNEEQLHLISHLKKLEKTDPVRVEKLRRYVNLDDKSSSDRQRDEYYEDDDQNYNDDDNGRDFNDDGANFNVGGNQSDQMKPLVSGYGDESPDQFAQKKLIDSEDEDDYTYDDVVRAASKNVVVPPMNSNSMQGPNRQNDFANDNFEVNSNFSRTSNPQKSSQLDTQNIIANLMGSLPKPGTSHQNPQKNYGKPISTIGQPEKPRPKPTVYDNTNPTYSTNSFNSSMHPSGPGGPQGGFMNQQNRPQFAPIQTANTSLNSMPYGGGGQPQRPQMQSTFPWAQQNPGQRQPPPGPSPYQQQQQQQYGNNSYY